MKMNFEEVAKDAGSAEATASSSSCDCDKNGTSHILNEVIKSPVDLREYRAFILANGMTVIVVSIPGTDISEAALNVMTGSLNDPKELPGLAHYLEHMLFMGTEKYPEENAYSNYLAKHAGSSNAETTGDNTCFYFDCSPDALEGAVDRFAQFFISPLFLDSCNEREVNAVHSEHEDNIPDDNQRKSRVHSFLTKQSHPYSSFDAGNKDTLWTIPKKNGVDVKSELLKFYQNQYSSNIMKLVVIGRQSCDELQEMVEKYFQNVKNLNIEIPHWPESPFGPDQCQTRIDILPVMDIRELTLVFPVPDQSKNYRSGVMHYLESLIGHEGPGSLLSLLKKKRWATGLRTQSDTPGRGFSFMYVEIDLTLLGLKFVDDIVSHVFQYLNMLKEVGPQSWYWEEIKVIKDIHFRFLEDIENQEEDEDEHLAVKLVKEMANCSTEEVWTSLYNVLSDYQPSLITDTLNCLVPDNVRIIVQTKENAGKVSSKEKYYGSKYNYGKISENIIQTWKSCDKHPELQFPPSNLFIPSEFELKTREEKDGVAPRIILDDELSRVWFLQDNEFRLPQAFIALDIINPCPKESPKNYNLQSLLKKVVRDTLAEYCYSATLAGLNYNVSCSVFGIRVQVSGYDHKVAALFEYIIKYLVSFDSVGNRFEDLREAFIRDLKNWKDEEPSLHAADYIQELLSGFAYTNKELLSAVDELTTDNLLAYAKKMFSAVKLQWLIFGNMTEEEAFGIQSLGVKHFQKIGSQALTAAQLLPGLEVSLPSGCNYVYSADHKTDSNSCVHVLLQFDIVDLRSFAVVKIISNILSEPCFDILRTKEQLGYTAQCMYRESNGVLGLEIVVQGRKHPEFIESRVENFLKLMAITVEELNLETFETYRSSCVVTEAQKGKPKILRDRFRFIDLEIEARSYNFEFHNLMINELLQVTLSEIKNFYKDWIDPGSKNRKKLSVHVVSVAKGGAGQRVKSHASKIKRFKHQQDLIGDPKFWKSGLSCYPYPRPWGDIPPWKTRSSSEL